MILSPREAASKVDIATAVSARVGQIDKRLAVLRQSASPKLLERYTMRNSM